MRLHLARLTALSVMILVGGCSRGPEKAPLEVEVAQAVGQKVAALRNRSEEVRPPPTRAQLDTVKSPYIEVTLERHDLLAYLRQEAVRRDGDPGQIVVWRTDDNVTLALRNGVLIATRGLGDDLLSASALVGNGASGPQRGGARSYHIRGLDNESRSLNLACDLQGLGAETIEIVALSYATRHLQQRCEGGEGAEAGVVVNDYWVDSVSGRLWQSRQWAGPTIGYLRIRQLTL